MLEQEIFTKLSKELQVAPEFIAREAWEIIILKELFAEKWADKLIFKGGTALRLAYQSPRFSIDLDFSIMEKMDTKDFFDFIDNLANKYPEIKISDKADKFHTLLAEIKISEPFLERPFSIKIEISKRKERLKKTEWLPKILKSSAYPFEILANVATLDKIYSDKLSAAVNRRAPRDLFDLWYLSEILERPFVLPKTKLTAMEIKRELNKFLPKNYQKAVQFIIDKLNK